MSEDPLMLAGLQPEAVQEAVDLRKKSKNSKTLLAEQRADTAAKREDRLASKGETSAPPPMPPPPPPPVVDKSAMLDKLEAYRERFPKLKSRNKLTGKSTGDEIADELHYVEQQLGQREGNMGTHVFLLGMSAIEEVAVNHYNPLGLNLSGLSKVTRDNIDQFEPILDELFIKYGASMYVGPEWRLAMATATMVYTVHSANNGNPTVAEAMAKMNQKVTATPSDL